VVFVAFCCLFPYLLSACFLLLLFSLAVYYSNKWVFVRIFFRLTWYKKGAI
ncbi:MAG: hypothetical protein ACI9FJ_001858, partial [Alteromonadaceae bacterium]